MQLLRALACAAFALAAAQGDAAGNASVVTEDRHLGPFLGLVASGAITVNVTRGDEGAPVSVRGPANLVGRLLTNVSPQGALIVALLPGTFAGIEVQVPVPRPLQYVAASAGVNLTADVVAGPLSASAGSHLRAGELRTVGSASLSAAAGSSILLGTGSAHFMTVTSSSMSRIQLGGLRTQTAVVVASAQSSVSGLEAESVTITASSGSSVNVTASSTAAYTCSSGSEITISGGAQVTEWWKGDCRVTVHPAAAARSDIVLP